MNTGKHRFKSSFWEAFSASARVHPGLAKRTIKLTAKDAKDGKMKLKKQQPSEFSSFAPFAVKKPNHYFEPLKTQKHAKSILSFSRPFAFFAV